VAKVKPKKTRNLSKTTKDKQVNSSIPRVGTTIVAIEITWQLSKYRLGRIQ
jgi:hypothetical protein